MEESTDSIINFVLGKKINHKRLREIQSSAEFKRFFFFLRYLIYTFVRSQVDEYGIPLQPPSNGFWKNATRHRHYRT